MKKLLILLLTIVSLAGAASSWANSTQGVATVVTTAGGTLVCPAGTKNYNLIVCNTGGTNTMDCNIGGTPTAAIWSFQLAANTCTTNTTFGQRANTTNISQSIYPPEAITCLAISASTSASCYER